MDDGCSVLRYSVRREPDVAVVELTGELDLGSVDQLQDVALDVFASGQPNIALDLSGITFIDSTGIGAVVALANHAAERSGSLKLKNPSPQAMRVIELAALDRHLEVTLDDRER